MTDQRFELQSLRGFAALIVVISHSTFYYAYDPTLKVWAEAAFNAHAAVICFFVLSGFVLTLSLDRGGLGPPSVVNFFIRRGFRIYPALWIATAFAMTYGVFLAGHPFSPLVDPWWGDRSRSYPSFFTVAGSLSGVVTSLKVPVWTLYVELVGSALMPAFVLCLSRNFRVFCALLVALGALSLIETWPLLLSPGRYLVFFALGAFMTRAPRYLPALSSAPRLAIVAAAVLCALIMWFGRWAFDARFLVNYGAPVPALIEGLAAAALIGIIYAAPAPFKFLRHRWAIHLGDISYGLYLYHLTILGWVAFALSELLQVPLLDDPVKATLVLVFATIAISLVVASLLFTLVERPAIATGRAVGKHLADMVTSVLARRRGAEVRKPAPTMPTSQ